MFICQNCGKHFKPKDKRKNKFCCVNCYNEAKKSGKYKRVSVSPAKECTNCGKPVRRSFVKNRKGEACDKIFCSRNCYDDYRIKTTKKIIYHCKECGKEIVGYKDRELVFCSIDCRRKSTSASKRVCPICGKVFQPTYINKKGEVRHPNNRKMCSLECVLKNYSLNEERKAKISAAFTGEKHPGWLGGRVNYRGENWRRNKRAAIKRDRACKHCGMTPEESKEKYNANLEVHHIKPFRYFSSPEDANVMDNLITLCKSCHKKAEWEFHKKRGGVLNGNKINKKNHVA